MALQFWRKRATPLPPPQFQWDFKKGVLHSAMSFSRASTAMYWNSSGVLTQAASGAARFDYDPVTLLPLGYLAEMASANALPYSRAFTASGWSASAITVTDNDQVAPDGTTTAAKFVENSASSARAVEFSTINLVLNSVYGVSVFVKNLVGSRWLQLNISGGHSFNFQPSTGTIGSVNSGSNSVASVVARSVGNGWYRISALFTWPVASGGTSLRLYMVPNSNSGNAASYAGDGSSAIAVWGAQVESAGVGVTSYIPTHGAPVTRAQDILTMPLSSLPGWSASVGGVLRAAFMQHTQNPGGYNATPVFLRAADANNSVIMLANWGSTGSRRTYVVSGSSFDAVAASVASPSVFTRSVQAAGWSSARIQQANDGGNLVTGTPTALPVSPTTLELGSYSNHGLNGTIETIAYYNGARPDAFVVAASR